jgi:hypothetical protein
LRSGRTFWQYVEISRWNGASRGPRVPEPSPNRRCQARYGEPSCVVKIRCRTSWDRAPPRQPRISADGSISDLLEAIKDAREAAGKLDIRIILGKIFSKKDLPKEHANLDLLKQEYGLVLGKNIRYIDTSRFVHCHNKMVLVDGVGVLVSSQNWSNSAVSKNREAGVWFSHSGICGYFTQMFENDWKTALKAPDAPAKDRYPRRHKKTQGMRADRLLLCTFKKQNARTNRHEV